MKQGRQDNTSMKPATALTRLTDRAIITYGAERDWGCVERTFYITKRYDFTPSYKPPPIKRFSKTNAKVLISKTSNGVSNVLTIPKIGLLF